MPEILQPHVRTAVRLDHRPLQLLRETLARQPLKEMTGAWNEVASLEVHYVELLLNANGDRLRETRHSTILHTPIKQGCLMGFCPQTT